MKELPVPELSAGGEEKTVIVQQELPAELLRQVGGRQAKDLVAEHRVDEEVIHARARAGRRRLEGEPGLEQRCRSLLRKRE